MCVYRGVAASKLHTMMFQICVLRQLTKLAFAVNITNAGKNDWRPAEANSIAPPCVDKR
jgi:hypothetical protein